MTNRTPARWLTGCAPTWGTALGLTVTCALLAMAVAGCGVRGSLENPAATAPERAASAESGQGKPEDAAPKPHRGFILDGLIR